MQSSNSQRPSSGSGSASTDYGRPVQDLSGQVRNVQGVANAEMIQCSDAAGTSPYSNLWFAMLPPGALADGQRVVHVADSKPFFPSENKHQQQRQRQEEQQNLLLYVPTAAVDYLVPAWLRVRRLSGKEIVRLNAGRAVPVYTL
jgi:hypothetical protein